MTCIVETTIVLIALGHFIELMHIMSKMTVTVLGSYACSVKVICCLLESFGTLINIILKG